MKTLFNIVTVACVTTGLGYLSCAPVMAISVEVSDSFVYVATDGGAGGYEAFPDVTRLQDGRLMAVFYEGYTHISPPTTSHPNGGRIMFTTSTTEGSSWSVPSVLVDTENDNRDPSIAQLPNGLLLCTYFNYLNGGQGTYLVKSNDSGATWSSPEPFAPAPYYVSSPVRQLSSGRLLTPLYYEGNGVAHGAVTISDNGGETWSAPIDIPNSSNAYLDAETDIIQLKNGNLWAIQRSSHSPARFSVSADDGNTWNDSSPLGFVAHSPYLMRTAHDDLIVLGYRGYDTLDGSGNGFTALRYSLDECLTWSDPIIVDHTVGAYPSMLNLHDGSVLIAYYEEGNGSNIRARILTISNTPEPSTTTLLTIGLTSIIGLTRRKPR
jgi:sialidase-1